MASSQRPGGRIKLKLNLVGIHATDFTRPTGCYYWVMHIDIGEVRRVAYEARADFESGQISEDLLVSLYGEYCKNIDPRLFVSEALKIFPRGNCGLASVYMRYRLQDGEAVYGSYAKEGHTVLARGRIILLADITSDQFGGPTVYVGPVAEPWSLDPPAPYAAVGA